MKHIFEHLRNRAGALALGGAVAAAGAALAITPTSQAGAHNPPVKVEVDERPVARETAGRTTFAPVVKKVSPGVVKVFTTTKARQVPFTAPPEMDDFFRRFFGEPFGERPQRRFHGVPRQEGVGSGVIVTKDGYILTNNHVVDGADEVKVALQDGREFTAKVVGRDPKTDVAVIKINTHNLPAVVMADSDKVEVGDIVLAVGNPFGIGQTVTTGIVSATGRAGTVGLDYEDFIQTDAAINPGNSGGALVDVEGRLIGINTAILSRSGGNQGIGFAIPSNLARSVMDGLISEGRVARGYLGVAPQDVTPALAKEFQLPEAGGVLLGDVVPDGPAEKAGLKNGDVILEFGGKKVKDARHFRLEVAQTPPGESVTVKFLRDGKTQTVEVKLKEVPGAQALAKAEPAERGDTGTLNGVTVDDLNRAARQELNVPEGLKGAVVTEVQPDSAAAAADLRLGDVILEINHQPVRNANDAVKLTEHPKSKTTLLRIWRAGLSRYLVVDETQSANQAG